MPEQKRPQAKYIQTWSNLADQPFSKSPANHSYIHKSLAPPQLPFSAQRFSGQLAYEEDSESEEYQEVTPSSYIPEAQGYVHSVQSMSAVDGPGLRYLFFLQGCAYRCLFCCNPDTWQLKVGPQLSSKEAAKKLATSAPYLRPNKGGVTVSGGEPLLQPEFVQSIFREAHQLGLTTCLDTTGQGTHVGWDSVLPHTDMVLFCVKAMEPGLYARMTGKPRTHAMKFVAELERRRVPFIVRYVLVPGMTDTSQEAQELVSFVRQHSTCLGIELLPYHRLGVDKYEQLGLTYPLQGVKPPKVEETREFLRWLEVGLEGTGKRLLCNLPAKKVASAGWHQPQ